MKKKGGWLAQRREREVEESPQRVVVTCWGLLDPVLRVEGERKPPTSRDDSLVVGWLSIASGRPPTSRGDSLGVVGPGVEGGRGEKTTNESR